MLKVFIPVKVEGKTRLSNYLTKEERITLIKCMLKDLLNVILKMFNDVYIIADKDLDIKGVKILRDNSKGLKSVLEIMNKETIDESLFIPVDVPLIDENDLKRILSLKNNYDYILSPARRNGISLIYRKKKEYEIIFSNKSFIDSLNYCIKNKINYFIYFSKNLYFDIDTVEDIYEFLNICKKKNETYKFLSSIVKR